MSFSRLQLAAALIEYDNEEIPNPSLRKDAKQSAIFNTQRQPRPTNAYAKETHAQDLRHSRPFSAASGLGHAADHSYQNDRKSMMSMRSQRADRPYDVRRGTMMTTGSEDGTEEQLEDLSSEQPHGEVDLASWGIPEDFLAKQKEERRNLRNLSKQSYSGEQQTASWRPSSVRTQSIMGMEPLKDDPQEELRPLSPTMRHAISSMRSVTPHVDFSDRAVVPQAPALKGDQDSRRNRTVSFHDYSAQISEHGEIDAGEITRPGSSLSMLDRGRYQHPVFPSPDHDTDSIKTATVRSKKPSISSSYAANVALPESPASSSMLGLPNGTISLDSPADEMSNPFALPSPAGPRVSRFDPKIAGRSHQRTPSGLSQARPDSRATGYFGQVGDDDSPHNSGLVQYQEEQPSRLSMLRPKNLFMPTPLQGQLDPSNSAPSNSPDKRGFVRGQRPMPIGAVRPNSLIGSLPTSGSLNQMSVSQRMFSDSLTVDGARGEYFIGGARQDGEVAFHQVGGRPVEEVEEGQDMRDENPGTEDWRPVRPVTGLSLMDKLEAKKSAMHGKRRVFTGDSRPTMMTRDDSNRQSLMNMSSQNGPVSSGPQGDKRNTLLNLEDSPTKAERPGNGRHKSVFGVDQIWNRDLERMRKQEEMERLADEQINGKRKPALPLAQDFELEGDVADGHQYDLEENETQDEPLLDNSASRSGVLPVLPPIVTAAEAAAAKAVKPVDIDDWGASDDEIPNRRPRKEKKKKNKSFAFETERTEPLKGIESSDEDVPLAQAFKVTVRPSPKNTEGSSSEDEPLSKIASKGRAPTLPAIPQVTVREDDLEEEDDVPLAVRRMTMMSGRPQTQANDEDDDDGDDVPLAQRHMSMAQSQQQQQNNMMMAQQQQQQQQQQMLFQQSMYPMSGGFGMPQLGMAPMGMPMMNPYMGMNPSMMSLPMPPPPQDPGIDRWRREIDAREGSVISGGRSAI